MKDLGPTTLTALLGRLTEFPVTTRRLSLDRETQEADVRIFKAKTPTLSEYLFIVTHPHDEDRLREMVLMRAAKIVTYDFDNGNPTLFTTSTGKDMPVDIFTQEMPWAIMDSTDFTPCGG